MPTDTVISVPVSKTCEPSGKEAVTRTAASAPSVTPVGTPAPSPLASTLKAIAVGLETVGAESLSVMDSSAPVTDRNRAAVVVPDTVNASSPSSTSSAAVVKVKEADPLVAPAGMVTSKSSTAVKSSDSA